jgi:hypothetical protein
MAYASADELARILQLTGPSAAQTVALDRVLEAAATEIDAYLARTTPLPVPAPDLVVSVNLDRAADLWKSEQSPYGIVNLGGETAPAYPSRNSFRRHANKLLPLKEAFGVA